MIEDTINELISYAKIHLGMNEFDSLYFKNILLGELGISKPSTSIVDIHKIENLMVPDSLLDKIKEYLVNVKKWMKLVRIYSSQS
jgi:hypothetical protein